MKEKEELTGEELENVSAGLAKHDTVLVSGTVTERLPHQTFTVTLEDGSQITAHPSAKLRSSCTTLFPGDPVTVEMSPSDKLHGRIILRNR